MNKEKIMTPETRIIKGYDDVEKIMEEIEGTNRGIWLTASDSMDFVYLTFKRIPVVNIGLAKHRFNSLSEAINYILEFLFN